MEGISTRTRPTRIRVIDRESLLLNGVDEINGGTAEVRGTHPIRDHTNPAEVPGDVTVKRTVVEEELVTQARAAARLHSDPKRQVLTALGIQQRLNLGGGSIGQDDAFSRCRFGHVGAHDSPSDRDALILRRFRRLAYPHASRVVRISLRVDNGAMTESLLEPQPTPLALLLLGQQADPGTEAGVECPGSLPSPSDPDLVARAAAAKAALGDRVFILGHHYQRNEVIQFADVTGDSFKLAQQAAAHPEAEYIVFCGVHFMAESADILTADHQQVVLPDLAAGCSMADMADIAQVEQCWRDLTAAGVADVTIPITYMNSSAAIKAFTGRHGGSVCTSSNAERSMSWAFERGEKILFLPDQHLGRNTAVRDLGLSLDDCVVYNPNRPNGGLTVEQMQQATVLLWRGHCSVHGRFTADCVDDVRERVPGINVIVHPECSYEVVEKADVVGSTEKIIATVAAAEPGSAWAIGTELNLVKRIAQDHPDKTIVYLDRTVCFCSTMNRIDLPHLVWALESLVEGTLVNQITVDDDTAHWARVALDRMLALPGPTARQD